MVVRLSFSLRLGIFSLSCVLAANMQLWLDVNLLESDLVGRAPEDVGRNRSQMADAFGESNNIIICVTDQRHFSPHEI